MNKMRTTDVLPGTSPGELGASRRSRLGSCLGVRIVGTGSYVPEQIVTNESLASLGCDSDWIVQRTGIRERRKASPFQATSDLAYEASLKCLEHSGVKPSEVDLILCATMTPDHATPSTACLIQKRLGCIAPAMDVNAACAGFMYAYLTAAQFVKSGFCKNALVIGAEVMSRTVNESDIKTYPLFGDGAGAVLLSPVDEESDCTAGIIRYTLGAEGELDALCIPGGGSREPLTPDRIESGRQFLHMDGRSVFKWAVRVVEESIIDVLTSANVQPQDLKLVVLHQANIRILDAAMSRFEIDRDKMFVNLDRFGNTSAASIPLALDEANQQGKLQRGDLVLVCGFGAGLSWGTSLVRW